MASLDFQNMSKHELRDFRGKAMKAYERPSVENNYFATPFSADLTNNQPTDWVPTKLCTTWCERHGPSNHETAECRESTRTKAEPAGGQKPKIDMKRYLLFRKHELEVFVAMRIQEKRLKKAAKRKQSTSNDESSSHGQQ